MDPILMDPTLTENRSGPVWKVSLAMIIAPTVATAIRIWSRAVTGGPKTPLIKCYWWDDWLAFIALVSPIFNSTCS